MKQQQNISNAPLILILCLMLIIDLLLGTPSIMTNKVSVNLNDVFNDIEDDVTITPTEEHTAYQTALDQSEIPAFSSIEADSIKDMEMLRSQIHSALYPASTEVSPGALSDVSSVDTMILLRSALPQASPELQLDENGVLLASMSNLRSFYPTHSPSNIMDSSLVAENTILKENIEKERLRRKHCEEQINGLQQKLLESQEQLAVMVSTDRKKQLMIQQLDKTLASIVDGWKKKETNQIIELNWIKEEKEHLESAKERQEELLSNFETELAEAVETINQEQNKVKELNGKFEKQIADYEEKLTHVQKQNDDLQQQSLTFEEDKHKILKEKERCLSENAETLMSMETQVHKLELLNSKLEEDFSEERTKLEDTMKKHETQLGKLKQENDTWSSKVKDRENKIKIVHAALDEATKEKETLSMEVSLFTSKFEALKTKQDSEIRLKLESEFNQQIHEIQTQITITENELRTSQKKQIGEMMQRQKEEIEKYRKLYQQEIRKKDDQISKLRSEHEKDLQNANKQIASLSAAGQNLERQRSELMNRMKLMMQHHWDETVSLLGSKSNNKPSMYTDHHGFEPFSSTLQHAQPDYPPFFRHDVSAKGSQIPYNQYTQPAHPGYMINHQAMYTSKNDELPYQAKTNALNHPVDSSRPRTSSPVSRNHQSAPTTTVSSQMSYAESPRKEYANPHQRSPQKDQDPVSLLYQDLDEDEQNGNDLRRNQNDPFAISLDASIRSAKSEKDVQLTHFIEKLLQRSPGEPLDEVPVRDVGEEHVPESITRGVDHLLQAETPKNKQPIRSKAAFKKSVVRNLEGKADATLPQSQDGVVPQHNFSEEQLVNLLKNLLNKEKESATETSGLNAHDSSETSERRKNMVIERLVQRHDGKSSNVSKKSSKTVRPSSNKNQLVTTKDSHAKKSSTKSTGVWK